MKQTQDLTTTWLAKVNLVNDQTARDHTHTTLSTALPSGPASGGPSELIDRPEHTCAVHARTAACHTRPNAWPFKGQAVASRPRTGTSCCCCGPAVAAAHELLLPSLCCLPSSAPVSVRTCRCPHLSERRTSTRMSQPPIGSASQAGRLRASTGARLLVDHWHCADQMPATKGRRGVST